jgi:hypothetical protein
MQKIDVEPSLLPGFDTMTVLPAPDGYKLADFEFLPKLERLIVATSDSPEEYGHSQLGSTEYGVRRRQITMALGKQDSAGRQDVYVAETLIDNAEGVNVYANAGLDYPPQHRVGSVPVGMLETVPDALTALAGFGQVPTLRAGNISFSLDGENIHAAVPRASEPISNHSAAGSRYRCGRPETIGVVNLSSPESFRAITRVLTAKP